jgi:hypothetical protein
MLTSTGTAQFYLPIDMSQQDLGTSFYTEVPLPRRPFPGRYIEIKRMPFVPNSGYVFVVNDLPGPSQSSRTRADQAVGWRATFDFDPLVGRGNVPQARAGRYLEDA